MSKQEQEQELLHQEEIFRNAFERAAISKCIVAASGRFLKVNNSMCELLGYTEEELLQLDFQSLTHPDDLKVDLTKVEQTLQGEINRYELEKRYIHKDGRVVWGLLSVSLTKSNTHENCVYFISEIQDITARKAAEEELQASLEEKEVLLKEIHHRVKNNLQILDSLLWLQYRRIDNAAARAALLESRNRIRSIALVHEKLYSSKNLATIQMADYIPSLLAYLLESQNSQATVQVRTNINQSSIDINRALPCGLIINEVVSNSFKHAFPAGRTGTIEIGFGISSTNTYRLVVRDDGIGLPENLDLNELSSLGLTLVTNLTRQLRGNLQIQSDRDQGTEISVEFPKEHDETHK